MMPSKRAALKKIVKSCSDGMGGPGFGAYGSDNLLLNPLKNAYYKRAKAANAFARIAKLTGLGNS